jgi:septum formation protein
MTMPKIILASTSVPRKMLMQRLQLPFDIAAPNVDETQLPQELPEDMVLRLAKQKAMAVAALNPGALIIGADQVGVYGNKVLGKPNTYENAISYLQMISGQCVRFLIGLCLLNTTTNNSQLTLETFDVHFRELSLTQIENYIAKDNPLNCAGSFQAEKLGIALVERFSGNDFTALIGLPLIRLTTLLKNEGVDVI